MDIVNRVMGSVWGLSWFRVRSCVLRRIRSRSTCQSGRASKRSTLRHRRHHHLARLSAFSTEDLMIVFSTRCVLWNCVGGNAKSCEGFMIVTVREILYGHKTETVWILQVDDTTHGYEPWRFIPQDIFDVLLGILPPSAKSVGSMRLVCRNWHTGVNNSVRSLVPSIDVPPLKAQKSWLFPLFSKFYAHKRSPSQGLNVSRIVQTVIPKIRGLQTLDLSQTSSRLSDCELEVLFSVPTIRKLIVPECNALTDKRLKTLGILKDSLQHLDVGFCKLVTSEGIKHIGQLTRIQTLSLDRCWRVTDDGFPSLMNLQFLRKLTVKDCWKITNVGIAAIGELKSLTHLNLDHCFRLTDAGMSSIAQLIELQHLNLTDCWNLTDDGISRLKGLINLTELNLEHCFRITDDSLAALSGLTNMVDFNLKDCWAITNNGIAHLKSWHHLKNLDIQHCYRVTDFGMDSLRGMTRIERLNLKDCWGLTDHTLSVFETLPRLSVVSMEHCFKVSDEGLGYLHSLPAMMYLNLKDCWGITDIGAASLATLPRLAYLNIKNCFKLTEEGLKCLRSKEELHLLC